MDTDYVMNRALSLLDELLSDGINLQDAIYESAMKNNVIQDNLFTHAVNKGIIE